MSVRRALYSSLLTVAALTPCGSARAHGEPPTAYAVVAQDAEGARVVRLNNGLALRRGPQRFQFVCPAAWGDEYAAPAAALADGAIVIGASSGLMLLDADGSVRPHPDAAARSASTELVRGTHAVFSLRIDAQGSEVVQVDAERAQVVFRDNKSWYSLAALEDKLILLRSSALSVEQLTLSSDGQELERQEARLSANIDYAFARASGNSAYALLLLQTGPTVGVLRMNAFDKLAEGASSIAGPLALDAATLLAVDGKLSRLVAGVASPLAEEAYVLCLERSQALAYACTREGIAHVSEAGLGEPLFELSWLTAPNLEQLAPGRARERCDYQWQDLRFDLLALGTTLLEDASPDAGSAEPVEMEPEPGDAGLADGAPGEPEEEEDEGPEEVDAGRAKRSERGCALAHGERASGPKGWLLALASGLLFLRKRVRARSDL